MEDTIQELEHSFNMLVFWFFLLVIMSFIAGLYIGYKSKKPKKRKKNRNPCDCKDVNQCEKWCCAKENFTREQSIGYKTSKICKQKNRKTKVMQSLSTCETTVEYCIDCGEPLNVKIDC